VALSTLTGIDQPRLSRFERGETVPSVEELIAISEALNVDVLALMGVENGGVGSLAASRRLAKLLDRIPPSDRQLLMQIAELMAKRADKPA
jgi:transcriptional regulator with XRE-family HTH domain